MGRRLIADAARFGGLPLPVEYEENSSYKQILKRGLSTVNDPIIAKKWKSNHTSRTSDFHRDAKSDPTKPFCNSCGLDTTDQYTTEKCRFVKSDNRHAEANVDSTRYNLSKFNK